MLTPRQPSCTVQHPPPSRTGLRRRFWTGHASGACRILALILGCFAAGVHWDVLQVFAWTTMLRDNVRTLAPTAAIARTFSPEGRCPLCHAIDAGRREQEETAPVPGMADKSPLLAARPAPAGVVFAPEKSGRVRCASREGVTRREAPRLPPPRLG
jgi:hypothetical protein